MRFDSTARPAAPPARSSARAAARSRRRSSAAASSSLLVVLLLLAARPAAAQDDERARAGALVDEGVVLFQRGDYGAALERFERAHQLYPSAKIQFNIGEALRQLGRAAEAAESYDRFLGETEEDSRDLTGQRTTARAALDGLERTLGRIALVVEPAAQEVHIEVDGMPARLRAGRPLYVAPGRHVVEVSAPGFRSVRTELAVGAGELRDLSVALGREEAGGAAAASAARPALFPTRPAPEEPPAPPPRRRVWTWVAAGAAASLLGGGIVFGLRARSAYDEYEMTDSPARYDELRDQIERDSLFANILFAGGAAATIGSALLWVGEF